MANATYEIEYPEMPEKTGKVVVTRTMTDKGIFYQFEHKGGDIIGVTLELLMDSYSGFHSIYGDTLTIGPLEFIILGYESPAILICKYLGKVEYLGD